MKGHRSPIGNGRVDRCWAGVAVSLLVCVAATSSLADLKPAARPTEGPMRILRVMSSDPSCGPNCPEWISAEGRIMVGTAQAFAEVVDGLGGRRLPILIHSRGGSVADAIAMGRLIRARHLAVAVARTLISNCPELARTCPGARGRAITGALCGSACPLILAGGVERLVSAVPRVGVHQITTLVKEVEGAAGLKRTKKVYQQAWIDVRVEDYLSEMGVGDPVMSLARKTPATSVRWLSDDELRGSRLATLRLDNAAPILAEGANGLNGQTWDGDPPRPDLMTARGTKSLARAEGGRDIALETTFAYRRGGGAIEATIALREAGAKDAGAKPEAGARPIAAPEVGEVRLTQSVGGAPMRVSLPLASFCRLAHGGKFTAAPVRGTAAGAGQESAAPPTPPIEFEVAAMDGAKALFDEACP